MASTAGWPVTVAPGTIVVFTDIVCGWSTVALHRFYAARRAAGLDAAVRVDLRLYLLEDVNRVPVDPKLVELEKPVAGALAEELSFRPWRRPASEWPVTSLPANEAVHAAKSQSLAAAEELDMALRLAFWRDSRCISMRHEILDVAAGCDLVDCDALAESLDDGRARGPMLRSYRRARERVTASPHFVLADGSDATNPGVRLHPVGEPGAGFFVVDDDDPSVYDRLVRQAAT